jgi:hypothetical protein
MKRACAASVVRTRCRPLPTSSLSPQSHFLHCAVTFADFLKGTELVSISTATQNGGTNNMKLFEKEEDNQYSEVLLPIQVRAPVPLHQYHHG